MPTVNGALGSAIVAFVNTILGVVTNFGVDLTDTQKGSITALVNAGIVLIALVWTVARRRALVNTGP